MQGDVAIDVAQLPNKLVQLLYNARLACPVCSPPPLRLPPTAAATAAWPLFFY